MQKSERENKEVRKESVLLIEAGDDASLVRETI